MSDNPKLTGENYLLSYILKYNFSLIQSTASNWDRNESIKMKLINTPRNQQQA